MKNDMDFLKRFKVSEWVIFSVLFSYIMERLVEGDIEGLMVWWYFVLYLGSLPSE
tara:strand:+ start:2124 stop:2288 length:165 start_codon:yes stop_codon:yes gene_type:complete